MTKLISFRVTDDEFALFRQLAAADHRTLSAYFKRLAHQDSYKTGVRTHAAIVNQQSRSTTTTVTLPAKTPPQVARVAPATSLDDVFEDADAAAREAREAEERRLFEEGVEPSDEDA